MTISTTSLIAGPLNAPAQSIRSADETTLLGKRYRGAFYERYGHVEMAAHPTENRSAFYERGTGRLRYVIDNVADDYGGLWARDAENGKRVFRIDARNHITAANGSFVPQPERLPTLFELLLENTASASETSGDKK